MKLFFDTETTGKADFKAPPTAAHQPRIVQLGALLTDDEGKELQSINFIIKPNGFTIPKMASDIHGITDEIANAIGINIEDALGPFSRFWTLAHCVVAHNKGFDLLMLDVESFHMRKEQWHDAKSDFCTMAAMTTVCKIPGPYGFKWPKLQEAHKHAFGTEFEGAHDAMADVRACAAVYFWLQNKVKAVTPA